MNLNTRSHKDLKIIMLKWSLSNTHTHTLVEIFVCMCAFLTWFSLLFKLVPNNVNTIFFQNSNVASKVGILLDLNIWRLEFIKTESHNWTKWETLENLVLNGMSSSIPSPQGSGNCWKWSRKTGVGDRRDDEL